MKHKKKVVKIGKLVVKTDIKLPLFVRCINYLMFVGILNLSLQGSCAFTGIRSTEINTPFEKYKCWFEFS